MRVVGGALEPALGHRALGGGRAASAPSRALAAPRRPDRRDVVGVARRTPAGRPSTANGSAIAGPQREQLVREAQEVLLRVAGRRLAVAAPAGRRGSRRGRRRRRARVSSEKWSTSSRRICGINRWSARVSSWLPAASSATAWKRSSASIAATMSPCSSARLRCSSAVTMRSRSPGSSAGTPSRAPSACSAAITGTACAVRARVDRGHAHGHARHGLHQSLVLQAPQRLAHRGPAHARGCRPARGRAAARRGPADPTRSRRAAAGRPARRAGRRRAAARTADTEHNISYATRVGGPANCGWLGGWSPRLGDRLWGLYATPGPITLGRQLRKPLPYPAQFAGVTGAPRSAPA